LPRPQAFAKTQTAKICPDPRTGRMLNLLPPSIFVKISCNDYEFSIYLRFLVKISSSDYFPLFRIVTRVNFDEKSRKNLVSIVTSVNFDEKSEIIKLTPKTPTKLSLKIIPTVITIIGPDATREPAF
jgi:hypothetical protein